MTSPPPQPGRWAIAPIAERVLVRLLRKRAEQGLAEYQTPLMSHNGRDAGWDGLEELSDALMYAVQQRVEHQTTVHLSLEDAQVLLKFAHGIRLSQALTIGRLEREITRAQCAVTDMERLACEAGSGEVEL